MPIRGLRPASDLISPKLLWIPGDASPERLNSLLSLPVLPDTLAMFPPWPAGSRAGQQPVGPDDSLLGVVATEWQVGISELRRAAGAICVAMPDGEVSLCSAPAWTNVFELSERGAQALDAFGPILPWVANIRILNQSELGVLSSQLADRATQERDRRFRIALEFLSTGWVLTGTQEFMNYFIALDALYGEGNWNKKRIGLVSSRLEDPSADDKVALIVKIRHETLHGRCSSVEASRWLEYYRMFHRHPSEDLLHIVRRCLRNEPSAPVQS